MIDLMGFVNTIITHIANGNKNEERLVNVMGGTIIETESEKWVRQGIRQGMQQGQAKMIIELGQEDGQNDDTICHGVPMQKKGFMRTYWSCRPKNAHKSLHQYSISIYRLIIHPETAAPCSG